MTMQEQFIKSKAKLHNSFLEQVLNDLEYQKTDSNKTIVQDILSVARNDINYVWTKMDTLIKSIKHVKGYVGLSSNRKAIKIGYSKKDVSEVIADEFHDIVRSWSKKYKIELNYAYENETFYID